LPQKVTCAECNHLLYEANILKSPQDIIKKFDGRCPECNRKLSFEAKAISIGPYNEKSNK
jgi:DNA-directed RNA polymerase subunit RPC12/RpoP